MELRIFVLSRLRFSGTTTAHARFVLGPWPSPGRTRLRATFYSKRGTRHKPARADGYSPAKFAQECPAMFAHDPSTNRLSLVGETGPPWIGDDNDAWNYCVDCWERLFSTGDKAAQPIPFRDKASQANMVVSWRDRKRKAEELSDDEIDRPSASQNS